MATAETSLCTTGSADVNNCFGIMQFGDGKRWPKQYMTKEDSYNDFKRIWSAYYGKFPDLALAKKWTGNDNAQIWLNNVETYYNNH